MTLLRHHWVPLRETLGDAVLDAAGDEGISEIPNAEFCEWIWPDVAEHYRRLCADPGVIKVMAELERRKISARACDITLRLIAALPRDYEDYANGDKAARQRRAQLRTTLADLVDDARHDPDLGGLWFGVSSLGAALRPEDIGPAEEPVGATTNWSFADILESAADSLIEAEEAEDPKRRILLKSFVLLKIFALLEPHYKRAPNRQAETLASALLDEAIPPGTMTQLRKGERRRNHPPESEE